MRFHVFMCMYLGLAWFGLVCTWEDRLGWISGFWFLVSWTGKEMGYHIWVLVGLDEGVYGVTYFIAL